MYSCRAVEEGHPGRGVLVFGDLRVCSYPQKRCLGKRGRDYPEPNAGRDEVVNFGDPMSFAVARVVQDNILHHHEYRMITGICCHLHQYTAAIQECREPDLEAVPPDRMIRCTSEQPLSPPGDTHRLCPGSVDVGDIVAEF